jgi:signal peptidase I
MDALFVVEKLKRGETHETRAAGRSMQPLVMDKERIRVRPIDREPEVGDIVFCKVNGRFMRHLITARKGDQYQISNNHGHVNGWTSRRSIYGFVEPIR